MSKKNESSKKTTWEKLNAQAEHEVTANEPEIKEDAFSEKKSEASPNKLPHPSYEELEEQLFNTETQLEEHKSKVAQYKEQDTYRLAEMENIRRRCKLDIENAYKFSLEKIIKELLPVKDSLEAALAPITTENTASLKGIQLTLNQLQSVLEKNGVETVEPTTGEPFDAHYHQAMLAEENVEQDPNTILKVLQKGYLLNKRLMRPALVVVAKASEENTQSTTNTP